MTDSILVEFVIIFIFFAIACRIILTKINNKSGKKTIIDKKDKNEIIDKKNIIDKKIKNKINHITKNFLKLPDNATFNDLNELTIKIEKSKFDQNSIDMVKRIQNQVIYKDYTSCYYCGKEINYVTGRHCSCCNLLVCIDHILPENHGCKCKKSPEGGIIIYKPNGKWSPRH